MTPLSTAGFEKHHSTHNQLVAAYAACRAIARTSAKNFYYAFLILPSEKRNALCAVYAFMRHADDISDDERVPAEERYQRLEAWWQQAQRAFAGEPTDDAVLLALAHAQRHFQVPAELFGRLVQGTAMDVHHPRHSGQPPDPTANAPVCLCPTFDDLYRYCYHVASVVGLVCIRIFGYRDPAAEALAEKCGIAFQLTNIIRDVKEDAEMGRIYVPAEDLSRFGRSAQELSATSVRNGFDPRIFRPLLEFETQRAREFYKAGRELIALTNEDSRPALWALIEIYSRLLEKIGRNQYDVFSRRIQLSAKEKFSVLARGMLRRLAA